MCEQDHSRSDREIVFEVAQSLVESHEVSGHGFSRADETESKERVLTPAMARPSRPSDPAQATGAPRTFFVTTQTVGRRSLFQTTRMAELFIAVLRSCVKAKRFTVHDFVVMPDHVHILLTAPGSMSIEKAMQFIKGGFSYRAKKELAFQGEVWQRGFSDVRVLDESSFQKHCDYIGNNPVKRGLANTPAEFPFCMTYLKMYKQGLKPTEVVTHLGTTKVVP